MAEPDGFVAGDAESRLRADARRIVDAAIAAVEPGPLVRRALEAEPLGLDDDARLLVLAVGKAASAMAVGAREVLGSRIDEGLVLTVDGIAGEPGEPFRALRGGHPLPDERSVAGARAARDLVGTAGEGDVVLLLLSGGGSALLALPVDGVTLGDVRAVTEALLRAGADIRELNAVRKHLELLKGGGLARVAWPASVRALVLSDVVGDDPGVIASGPVSPDPSTCAGAIGVLERRELWPGAPESVRARLLGCREGRLPETPDASDPCFRRVRLSVVGGVGTAVAGAAARARELGYGVEVLSTEVSGEARHVGRELALRALAAEPPRLLVQGGETTVRVLGDGVGGPNQEVALGAALELEGRENVLVFSVGTDGVDGRSPAAGALASGRTVLRARELGLDAAEALDRNDSYRFFRALGDLVTTGPTGTNVMDVSGALVLPPGS